MGAKSYWLFSLIVFSSLIFVVVCQQSVGESCTTNTLPGTCTPLLQCPSALDDLRKRGTRPVVCGYVKFQQIVCCPNAIVIPTLAPLTSQEKLKRKYIKCKEYQAFVYEEVTAKPLAENSAPITRKNDKCGHTAVPLIVGGKSASPREFPHSALLGYVASDNNIKWDCGGSLVSPRFVLTAGHCLNSRDNGPVQWVKLGDLNILSETDDARPIDIRVEERIPHPSYTISSRYNDIALLKLAQNVPLSPYVRPACLPNGNESYKKAIATGWGTVEWAGQSSNTLLEVTLERFTQDECNATYSYSINRKLNRGIDETTQLCAGSKTDKKDTCQGDSGGPLQIYHAEEYCMYTQVGVTSFGNGCGTAGIPGVYSRVSYYANWIEGIVWPNSTSP